MTLQEMLDEAIAARHALAVGKARAVVRMADRSVEYTRATLPQLNAYIASLQAQLNPSAQRPRTFRLTQSGSGY